MSKEDLLDGVANYHQAIAVGLMAILICGYQGCFSPDAQAVREQKQNEIPSLAEEDVPDTTQSVETESEGWWASIYHSALDWFDGGDSSVESGYLDESERDFLSSVSDKDESILQNADLAQRKCVFINTDDWGFPEYYDPSMPEIRTATEALEELGVDATTGQVFVKQGDQIKQFNPADYLANKSEICVSQ